MNREALPGIVRGSWGSSVLEVAVVEVVEEVRVISWSRGFGFWFGFGFGYRVVSKKGRKEEEEKEKGSAVLMRERE